MREAEEEIGDHDLRVSAKPIFVWDAPDSSFRYSTFFATVREEFEPEMADGEHVDWKWVHLPQWLQHDDLHFGVEVLLRMALPAILELMV